MDKIIESLSPIEKKIIPLLHENIKEIIKHSGLDETSVHRALKFLEKKGLLEIKLERKNIVDLGVNGVHYRKTKLPERELLSTIEKNNYLPINDLRSISKLSDNEFKVSLGTLKNKGLISMNNGKVSLATNKEEITKKLPEEKFLETLPRDKNNILPNEMPAFENLKSRKNIIEIREEKETRFYLTELGKKYAGKNITLDLLEEVTPEIIKNGIKNKKFRRYDISARPPEIYGGKKHFVNQSIDYAKKIWLELGFQEMEGNLVQTSFWNFDALFTAQDHPVREMHDTFFLKEINGKLPNKDILEKIRKVHETGDNYSKGWQYVWDSKEAKKSVLRTHTTCLSARTLANIDKTKLPLKYFSVGKCFRNETVDWSHGFEFNQSEGIVIDRNANFSHLLGYLKEFFAKMGFEKIRFVPGYFPYTEPSVEVSVFHPERKVWLELGGAGMFRPEVTIPLLGEHIPILAWGPGLDRIMMDYYKIKDLRELYENNMKKLRDKKMWIK